MARPYPFHTLDVFTATRYAGNPLAVVLQADDLTAAQMQVIAAEFGLSETIFVMAPDDTAHEARVRIFTPVHEMPFAGHPIVGCAVHLAERQQPKGAFEADMVLQAQAGPVPVRLRREKGDKRVSATFTAPVVPHRRPGELDRRAIAAALDLAPDDIRADHPIGVHEGGPNFLYVPLASVEALGRARPTEPHWGAAVMRGPGLGGAELRDSLYAYAPDPDAPDPGASPDGAGLAFRARMFAPAGGVPEDPATGSASAILASQLLDAGELPAGTTRVALRQGVEMGRPSEIALEVDVADGALATVRVTGSAVRVMDGQIMV